MKLDVAYEIIDGRDDGVENIGNIGVIAMHGTVLQISTDTDRGLSWEMPDDDESLEDREAQGLIVLHTKDGPLTLAELTLDNFRRLATSLPVHELPDFKDDAEVNAYFVNLIRSGAV
jgi:hypothetical protein